MSRKPDDFTDYRLVEYVQPSYDDPRFYDPRQEDPTAFERVGSETALLEGHGVPQVDEYRGPESLEYALAGASSERREGIADASMYRSKETRNKTRRRLAGLGGLGASLAGLLIKFKTLLVLLFDIKWVAFLGKFGLASISAVISVAVYSRLFGWSFAVGLVVLLFIHEMGHAIVMRLKGIPVSGMIFIPLLGAAVFMRRMPSNARDEAEVGIAGPVAGALAALACLLIAHQMFEGTGLPGIWAPLAYFGCFLNLFNLIPLTPFDGGRVLAAIDRRIWIIGFMVLIAIQIWQWLMHSTSIWLLLFIIIAATDFWARRGFKKSPEVQAYYAVPLAERVIIGLAYFALAVALVAGMALAHDMMVL
jgi:Zn-dependent protease